MISSAKEIELLKDNQNSNADMMIATVVNVNINIDWKGSMDYRITDIPTSEDKDEISKKLFYRTTCPLW